MTQEEKNIKLCEATGWQYINSAPSFKEWPMYANWKRPDGVFFKHGPNHFTDLNAIHEAVMSLSYLQLIDYTDRLGTIVHGTPNKNEWGYTGFACASVEQCAEALGKTFKLW